VFIFILTVFVERTDAKQMHRESCSY